MSETTTQSRNLGLELRPRRFSEVVGHQGVLDQLRSQFQQRVPAAMMFVGPPGTGKTTLAKIIGVSLNCEHGEFGEPCEDCCNDKSYEIIERNAAALGTADDTRSLIEVLDFQPVFGKYRVIILDECQQMSQAAQNILLKPTEPDSGSAQFNIFIFCTTDPQKMIAALKSRCVPLIKLSGMSYEDTAFLVDRAVTAAGQEDRLGECAPLVKVLWERGITGPRDILKAVENFLSGVPVERAAVVEESGKVNVGALCGAVIQGDWEQCRKILADAEPNDGATVRVVITGFLRKKLLEAPVGTRGKVLSEMILELTDHNTPEVGIQLSAVCSSIYRICQMVQAAKASR